MDDLAGNLRRVREFRGLTQDDLASSAGVARSTITAIENGKRTNPGVVTVYALARVLGVTMEALMGAEALSMGLAVPVAGGGDGYTLLDAQHELEARLDLVGVEPFEAMTPAQMDAYAPPSLVPHAELIDAAQMAVDNHLHLAATQPVEWVALSFYMSGVLAHAVKAENSRRKNL